MSSSTSHADISKPHLFAMYLSSLAMFALAAALVYFSVELVGVAKQVPDILKLVEHTSDKIDPVVDEVAEIKEMVPSILLEVAEIRKLVKPAIAEYAKTNALIPRILDEVEAVRQSLPAVLTSVDNVSSTGMVISKEVAATRKTIPAVLKTVNDVSDTGLVIAKEVEGVRGLVPDILAEVKTTRESVPGMMADAEKLIDKARVAGKEASQGAITGIFSGILLAPFSFVGDVGQSLLGVSEFEEGKFTEEDYALIKSAAQQLLHHGELNEKKSWKNADSGSSGKVKLTSIDEDFEEDTECRSLLVYAENSDGESEDREVTLCKDEDGEWGFE